MHCSSHQWHPHPQVSKSHRAFILVAAPLWPGLMSPSQVSMASYASCTVTQLTSFFRCKVTYDESLLCQIVPPVDLNEISSFHQQQLLTDVIVRIYEPQEGNDEQVHDDDARSTRNNCSKWREIRAHKVILASRSSVFATMFSRNNYKEASNSVVNVYDVSFVTAQQLIHFIYCGNVRHLNQESAMHLLYAAEKYDIEDLKNICVRYLSSHLTHDTAAHVEAIADSFNLHRLKYLASKKLNVNWVTHTRWPCIELFIISHVTCMTFH